MVVRDFSEEALTMVVVSNLPESRKLEIIENFKEILSDFGKYRVRRYLSLEGLRYFLEKLNQEINKEFKNE